MACPLFLFFYKELVKKVTISLKRPYTGDVFRAIWIEYRKMKKVVNSMDMKEAVICRLNDVIRQRNITVNEAAVRSGVPPSTLKNILYGESSNVGVITIKKLCDGLNISIPEFFGDSIFADLEPELK